MKSASWCLITGATAGIGAATAHRLADAGWSLILTGRRADRLQDLQRTLSKKVAVEIFPFDVTNVKALSNFANSAVNLLPKIDVLINNAGLARGTESVQTLTLSDSTEMIETNINALIAMTRLVLPHFVEKKSGHIINLGSVAGRWVYPGGAVYCATKHAVRAFSEGLRMDLHGSGVRVTNIEPGMVKTEFSRVRLRDEAKADAIYKGFRPLMAEDIAESIYWAIQQPPHVNIQELVIFPTDQSSIRDVFRK